MSTGFDTEPLHALARLLESGSDRLPSATFFLVADDAESLRAIGAVTMRSHLTVPRDVADRLVFGASVKIEVEIADREVAS